MKKKKLKKRLKLLEQKLAKSASLEQLNESSKCVSFRFDDIEEQVRQLEQTVQDNGIMIKESRDHIIQLEQNTKL